MLTHLSIKVEMPGYGLSDRIFIGVFDCDDELEKAVTICRVKWQKQKIHFYMDRVEMNKVMLK